IGLELARRFAARADDVVAVCRGASDELRSLDVQVLEGVDVSDAGTLERLAAELAGTHVDILVNNAGILEHQTLDEMDWEGMRRQFEVNSLGPLRVTHALLDNLGEGSKVAIVTSRMGSIADNTSGGSYGYRMSKAAVNAAGV